MKTHKLIILAIFALGIRVYAGQEKGGGDPNKIDEAAIVQLLEGGGLKNAMLNYLKTLSLEKIDNLEIRETFVMVMKNGALEKDILTPNNYLPATNCKDSLGNNVPASTNIGEIGGQICFDVKKIASDYENLSFEEAMIRLASLAFHEHIHHFQNTDISHEIAEKSAYDVSAYILITAKFVQVPLLRWQMPDLKVTNTNAETLKTLRQRCSSRSNAFEVLGQRHLKKIISFLERDGLKNEIQSVHSNWSNFGICRKPDGDWAEGVNGPAKYLNIEIITRSGIQLKTTACIRSNRPSLEVETDRLGNPKSALCFLPGWHYARQLFSYAIYEHDLVNTKTGLNVYQGLGDGQDQIIIFDRTPIKAE